MKTMKYLSMAALAVVGAVVTGCSSDDNIADGSQSATQDNIVTVTTTVGFDEGAQARGTTRALRIDYENRKADKTFAVGDQVALVYENTSEKKVMAVSEALTAEDISAEGNSATLTFTLTNPKNSQTVEYFYPASLVSLNENGNIVVPIATQDGTLADVASHDYACCNTGSMSGTTLSPVTLENKFAIVAFTLKDADGTHDITSTITGMTIKAGSENYTVKGHDTDGRIYVIMRPTDGTHDITITANDGIRDYTKTLTGKTYAANNFYQQGLRMTPQSTTLNLVSLPGSITAQDGDVLTGTLNVEYDKYMISIADGATVTLNGVTINGANSSSYHWAGITCLGDATIILSGTNTVKGFYQDYPGIYVPSDKTLTISGIGSLDASSNGAGAGIGGGFNLACGNIRIEGGTITATGGAYSAGIGGGNGAACGDITITNTVTKVTATKGENATNSIGAGGNDGRVGTVTIGGVTGAITDSPYTYQP
ncbi:MAG: hypothetical protein IJ200_02595 [Prevotella sp.]|nr:hypothetical protein [Prevotella sp.]